MELRTYWKILLRRWWLVVAPVAVVAGFVAITYAPPGASYGLQMRFVAGTKPAGLSVDYDRYYPWFTSEYIARGLADIAETQVFARAVAARLGEAGLEGIAAGDIRAGIVTDHTNSLILLDLTWADGDQIEAVAQGIADELTENSAAYYPQLEGLGQAVRLADVSPPALLAPGLRAQLMGPAIRIGLALAVGLALALLWHYLDPTVREVAELEEAGLDVLAAIPRHK